METLKNSRLIPKEIADLIPPSPNSPTSMEHSLLWVKIHALWTPWEWYIADWDGVDLCYGVVRGYENEIGSFSLRELEDITGPGGLKLQRDVGFEPGKWVIHDALASSLPPQEGSR